jgi:hypothetical protein
MDSIEWGRVRILVPREMPQLHSIRFARDQLVRDSPVLQSGIVCCSCISLTFEPGWSHDLGIVNLSLHVRQAAHAVLGGESGLMGRLRYCGYLHSAQV